MMRICMCHDVWKYDVFLAGENKSMAAAGEYEEFRSLGITTEDDWENNPAGEYIGERMALWGRDALPEDLLTWRNNLGCG